MVANKITKCRTCQAIGLIQIHDFNEVPLADKLSDSSEHSGVPSANLSVAFCTRCAHLQVLEDIAPSVLFRDDYPYFSSKIPEVVKHFEAYYDTIISEYPIQNEDQVIEIASNDGVLLQNFKANTTKLLGIEPSLAPSKQAVEKGIQTVTKFFSLELAQDVIKQQGFYPKLIMANNVLAHVPDPIDFVKGLKVLSNEKTIIIVEVPHSLPMVQANTFDVIFHQHFSYFNLKSLTLLFENEGLYINKLEKVPTQGGSLRLHISQLKLTDSSVEDVLADEHTFGLYDLSTYYNFSKQIDKLKSSLNKLLDNLKAESEMIVGYGAPGKAATLLNYFEIDRNKLDYLVDVSTTKHNKYFPFTGLKIYNIDELEKNLPDYILILAWNYSSSIMKNLAYLKEKQVKFIEIYPEVRIIG